MTFEIAQAMLILSTALYPPRVLGGQFGIVDIRLTRNHIYVKTNCGDQLWSHFCRCSTYNIGFLSILRQLPVKDKASVLRWGYCINFEDGITLIYVLTTGWVYIEQKLKTLGAFSQFHKHLLSTTQFLSTISILNYFPSR